MWLSRSSHPASRAIAAATMENIGTVQASNVEVTLSTENEYISITDDTELYGDFTAGSSLTVADAFTFDVGYEIPDNENVYFSLEATDGTETWTSQVVFKSYAPVLEFVDFQISDPTGNNNGRIDPGETVLITVFVANNGSSEAFDVMGELICAEPGITVNTSAQLFGDLDSGSQADQTFEVMADGSMEEGLQITFNVDISGEGGVNGQGSFTTIVGQYIALILDLDPINYSGPGIHETFGDMEVYADYLTTFPEDLGLYKNVFVCLGLHFTNYELSEEEGQLLKDYLLMGGNLYMEGRVTWKDDLQTPVHSMFNVEVEDMGMFLIEEVVGVPGSITSNMTFGYEGNNPVCDHSINPIAPAYSLFYTQDTDHVTTVAYNAGTYRAIASTVEFGKLVDEEAPSTKTELMELYLDWFEGLITGLDKEGPPAISGTNISCIPNPFKNETSLTITVERDSEVSLIVYNLQGKEIKTIYTGELSQGNHQFIWSGENNKNEKVAPGLYFAVLNSGNGVNVKKLILSDQ